MSSISSPNYITPNNYISESFEIKQGKKGEQKYKLNIELNNNSNILIRISEENNITEVYEIELNSEEIRLIKNKNLPFSSCEKFYEYIKNEIKVKNLAINKIDINKLSIELKKDSISIDLIRKQINNDLIIKNLVEQISKLNINIKNLEKNYENIISENKNLKQNIANTKKEFIEENNNIKNNYIVSENKMKQIIEALKQEIQKIKENKDIKNDINVLKNNIIINLKKDFSSKYELLENSINLLHKDKKSLEINNKYLKDDIIALKENIKDFTNLNQALNDDINTVKKDIKNLENLINENNRNFKTHEKQIQNKNIISRFDRYKSLEGGENEDLDLNKTIDIPHKKLNYMDLNPNEENNIRKNRNIKRNLSTNKIGSARTSTDSNKININKINLKSNTRPNTASKIYKKPSCDTSHNKYCSNNNNKIIPLNIFNNNQKCDKFAKESKDRINNFINPKRATNERYENNLFNKNNINNRYSKNDNINLIDDENKNNLIPIRITNINKFISYRKTNSQIYLDQNGYMNSILQCFINIEPLVQYFLENKNDIKSDKTDKYKGELSERFLEVIENLWENKTIKNYTPKNFKSFIEKNGVSLIENNENNQKEFINYLIEGLHMELNNNKNVKKYKNDKGNIYNIHKCIESYDKYFKNNFQSIISDIFYGKFVIKKKTQVLRNDHIMYNIDYFNKLIFPLYEVKIFKNISRRNVKIKDCFEYYQKSDFINNEEINKLLLEGPKVLIIILTRDNSPFNIKLDIEEEINLNLDIYSKNTNYNYKLIGVIERDVPSIKNGKFFSFCKNFVDSKWYKYVDSSTIPTNFVEIKNLENHFILFYSK